MYISIYVYITNNIYLLLYINIIQVGIGRDHTFWAKCPGEIKFTKDYWNKKTIVSVVGKYVPRFGPIVDNFYVPLIKE